MKLNEFYILEMTEDERLELLKIFDHGDAMADELLRNEKTTEDRVKMSEEWSDLVELVRNVLLKK